MRALPPPMTPLLEVLRQLGDDARREEFAALAGTSVQYLYQLGSCRRKQCRSKLAKGIADASNVMFERYGTPVVSMDTLATMCPVGC